MCGFAGVFDPQGATGGDELAALATAMASSLTHRGPDDGGCFADAEVGVSLGSRRLAVIDLSAEGHQPMLSASGRYALAYNGEIYNFAELRSRLESLGASFRGGSDTEVLLAAIEAWGIEAALREANGMFAFACVDRRERSVLLARDRLGEKPLYYGRHGRRWLFGSELKALRAAPGFHPGVDRDALARYLRLARVPAPCSIYEGVRQLPPGSFVTLGQEEAAAPEPRRYWSAAAVAAAGAAAAPANPGPAEAARLTDELEQLLGDAVALRMHADVPIGVFLSGGVDSSTVVALMQARSSAPVRSFTIGFEDPAYDESAPAEAVARHLGTEHTALRLGPSDAIEVIAELAQIYDEPFADSSQIPTYLVSRLARTKVTVSLSGDGGDELFGGYNRHVYAARVLGAAGRLPPASRRALARALGALSPSAWDAAFARVAPLLPPRHRHRLPGLKVHKLASILPAGSPAAAYEVLASTWSEPVGLVLGAGEPGAVFAEVPDGLGDPAAQMMFLDLVGYLPDDILVKLDRASMAVSLESRVPMLDHRVVELAWRIPTALKLGEGGGKWILRQVLRRHLPASLVDRPKAGFGLPLGTWLRGPLRSWAEELLEPGRLRSEGYLDATVVQRCWQEHLSGRRDLEARLWAVLMFQSWLQAWGS